MAITAGPTRAAGKRWSADVSLSRPAPSAVAEPRANPKAVNQFWPESSSTRSFAPNAAQASPAPAATTNQSGFIERRPKSGAT